MLQSPVRLRLLQELSKVDQALVGVLAAAAGVRPSVASHHLNLLASYDLVVRIPQGKYAFYRLAKAEFMMVGRWSQITDFLHEMSSGLGGRSHG